jgi:hypothetical protein
MLKNRKALMQAIITICIVALALTHIFIGQCQVPGNQTAENAVYLAQKAEAQVKSKIQLIYANAEAFQKIAAADLTAQLEGNVSLSNQSSNRLDEAEIALEHENFNESIELAQEALHGFGQVLESVNWILSDVGFETSQGIEASDILDAANRTLERIAQLRLVLPANATDQAALLDQAEALLNIEESERLVLGGNISTVAENLSAANQLLSQVYGYLKALAENANATRISGYLHIMEQEQERIRARIGHAGSQGINVTEVFEALGYHDETEFMNALQSLTQSAQGKMGDLAAAMLDLEVLGQMVRQLNQTLTQEMNRHQNQGGTGGSGGGNDSTWNGSQGSGNGSGPSNGTATPGTGGNSGSGTSGTGSGSNSSSGSGSGKTGEGNGPTNTETPDPGNSSAPSSPNEPGNHGGTPSGNSSSSPFGTTSNAIGATGTETTATEGGNSPSGTSGSGNGDYTGRNS